MSPVQNLFSQGTIERLGWMLVHFLWQATAVAVLLAVVLRLLRRADANLRYVVACLVLGLIVVLPVITIQLVEVAQPVTALPPTMPASGLMPSTPAIVEIVDEIPAFDGVPPVTADITAPIPWQERLVARVEPALPYAVLGWLAGVFGLSAWHLGGWAQLQRLKRRMVRDVEAALQQRLASLGGRLGVRRAVRLLESAVVEVPTVVGWLRPVILLPASALTGLSTAQLEAILAHELAHIRRCDYLVNVLQTIVEILGFYHPAVWWVSYRIRIERENCCDDLAVRVCGNSLQYARALTSMEEIRHRRTDLALAAAGGSLMSRIARLLGRPAGDDRRFTWLPGLLALLVVIGLVIPAALALGVSAPGPLDDTAAEAPAQDAAVPPDETQDKTEANEPPRTDVLISYTIAEVFADRILDPETATEASGLLMPIPPGNVYRAIGMPTVPPDAGELQKPLRDVLARFMPATGKDEVFADILLSRGYARVIARPKFLLYAGEPGVVTIGEEQDPNAPESQALTKERGFSFLRLSTVARLLDDQNATIVETKLVLKYPSEDAGAPNGRTTTTVIGSTAAIPNDEYLAVIERSTTEQDDESERQRLHILLVQPTIVRSPVSDTQPQDHTRVQVVTDGRNQTAASESPEANLLLNFTLIKAKTDKRLDREMVLQIENILGESIWLTDKDAGARQGPEDTLGEVLRKHTVGKPLPQETVQALTDLLLSKGYVELLASPQMQVRDGQEAQVRIGTTEYIPTTRSGDDSSGPPQLERVECGTTIAVTAHLGDRNTTTLEMAVELTDIVPGPNDTDLPLVRTTAIESTMTVPNDRYFSLLAEPAADQTTKTQEKESILVMVKPSVIPRRRVIESASDEPPKIRPVTATFTDANLLDALRVFSRQSGARIGVDMTVRPIPVPSGLTLTNAPLAVALQTVLQGTDYRFQTTDENTYLVFKTITRTFRDEDLREVLQDLSTATGVPIIPDPNVEGRIYADFHQQPLEKALEIILAGTPYAVKRMPDYYLVADRRSKLFAGHRDTGASWTERVVRRSMTLEGHQVVVRLNYVTPEQAKNLLSPAFEPFITINPTENTNPDYHGHVLTVTAPPDLMEPIIADICRIDVRPRQVLLNVLMVRMEAGDLAKLGIEWARPAFRSSAAERADNTGGRVSGVRIGYAADQAATDSFLAAVTLLQEQGRAKIVANPQLVAQDGRESGLRAMMEEWLSTRPAANREVSGSRAELHKIDYGTALSVTPYVGDNNEITLTMTFELSESLPRGQGQDLPVVTRRIAKNSVTIRDGGTVAVAELTENYAGQNGTPTGETVIFVTAQVLPTPTSSQAEPSAAPKVTPRSPMPQPTETFTHPRSSDTPNMMLVRSDPTFHLRVDERASDEPPKIKRVTATFGIADLLNVLAEISRRTGTIIEIDATVETGLISVELAETSVETALQQVLKETPYTFAKQAESRYLVYRPLFHTFVGQDLREALRRMSTSAGIPITLGPTVAGRVTASFENAPLEEALQIVLAGTPYVVRRTPRHYLVEDPVFPWRPQRQCLLDARVVGVEHKELLDLGITWASPTLRTGASSDATAGNAGDEANDVATRIQVGCTPDRAGTDMLLAALDRLHEDGRASILANPKAVTPDGREAQIRSVRNETFFTTAAFPEERLQEIDGATVLSITPHVGDANTITLESVVEISDSMPQEEGNPPGIVRRTARNTVAVQNGGTVVWSGLSEQRQEQKQASGLSSLPLIGPLFRSHDVNAPPREIAVFVTARLIPDAR